MDMRALAEAQRLKRSRPADAGLVVSLVSDQARSRPQAIALRFRDRRMSYAEMEGRSTRLARHLASCGVRPGIPVAVCLHPSFDLPIAMLAIWKARGIYLPIDPTHPPALIRHMLEEAGPLLVLTVSSLAGMTLAWPQLCLDLPADLRDAPLGEARAEDPATLLYTSGTTGKPKGVPASQGNLAHYLGAAARAYGFRSDDVFVSLARHTFSISLFELVSPLCCGAGLKILDRDDILAPDRLSRALDGVTVLHAGPSLLGNLFRQVEEQGRRFAKIRHASSGGDMVTPSVMAKMALMFPKAELFVIYGCTEISCMGTFYPIDRASMPDRCLVGAPFPGNRLALVDADLTPVAPGAVGEICIAGPGIVPGYRDRPDLTAKKFVLLGGKRFYRTGDLGRIGADGVLEILGRQDFQVQLRGIRIELAGIEATIQAMGLAGQCAVVARPGPEGEQRLVAFLVRPRNERIATFRRALAREIPDYALPHQVVVLDAMPLTVNGKLDRKRLQEMDLPAPGSGAAQPLPGQESVIAGIFARVLGLRDAGAEDDFFDLGGDSLLGAIALAEIAKATGIEIPPSALFDHGTPRALAGHDAAARTGLEEPIPLNRPVPGAPLFMLSGVHVYRALAARLEGRCSALGVFRADELKAFDPGCAIQSVGSLASDYVAIIRRAQKRGPYRLLGYSFSGIVAYEVARQLCASGEEIGFLAMIDAHLPEWSAGWRQRLRMFARLPSAPPGRVLAFFRRRLKGAAEEAQVYPDDAELGRWEVQRGSANYATIADYRPKIGPYSGKAVLLVSGTRLAENPLHSPSCGWGPFIRDLAVHRIEADHFQMMRDEPHIGLAAEILSQYL